ncbi:MAG: replicative DNA helicase, partial [Candidatus Taylorbacteria bacterium RIFCSPLOWO2_02_FULL_46_40]
MSLGQNQGQKSFRVPPQNLEAEKALLGSIMLRPETLHEIVDIVNPAIFYSEKHSLICKTILELWSGTNPVDLLSVSSRLKETAGLDQVGGTSYIADLVNVVPSAGNVRYYAELVNNKYLLRRLIDASHHIMEMGFDEAGDLDEILDRAEKKIFEVTNMTQLKSYLELKEALGEAWERLDALHKSKAELRGITTGFRDLDSLLAGFQKSDLIILAARPSMGKTALALDIARQTAVKSNTSVCIFSLEMSAQQLVDRMLAAEAQVNSWNLRTGRITSDDDFLRIRNSLDRLSTAPIYIDDMPGNNILKMRSVARRVKSEKNLGLIVVDYLQLMVPTNSRGSDSTVQQVTEISRSLKNLARELDVPVLALSQLNRAVEQRGGRPRLSDLRDSGCLAGDTLLTLADSGRRVP